MDKTHRVKVECLECGKVFSTASFLPECPKCGGSDIELARPIRPAVVTSDRKEA